MPVKFKYCPQFKSQRSFTLMVLIWASSILNAYGQDTQNAHLQSESEKKEKEKLVSISGSMQMWFRHTELNPGSKVFNQQPAAVTDISIRRYRLRFTGKASENLRYTLEFGNNDLSFYDGEKSSPHLLDAYVDYRINDYLAVGAGKQSWAGPTRYSAPATTQSLAYDIDFIGAPFVNIYDDILRRMGVYARGAYKGLDYRFSLAKPSRFNQSGPVLIGENARFSDREPDYQLSGYVKYQFLEKEAQLTPYAPGTYLGRKNILNLGIGMLQQPNTTWYLNQSDTVYHTAVSLAADLFYEKSLAKNRGLTMYLAYVHHNMGRNFVRYMGANNPATSVEPSAFVNGKGNSLPVIGTGNTLYMQVGFISPVDGNNDTQLQPYASLQYSSFEAFNEQVITYNTGINYYLNGQRSKITLGYQRRPVFKKVEHLIQEEMRKSMVMVQYQILFGG